MKWKILILALLCFFCGPLAALTNLQPRVIDSGVGDKKLPDVRKMIEEAMEEKNNAGDSTVPGNGPGAEYVLVEDPITRELVLKTNVIEAAPVEERKAYALDIKDLIALDSYVKNLRDQIKIDVFGDLQLPANSNKLDRGYAFYKDLNNIRNRYYIQKTKIEEKMDYLKKVTDYALEYTKNAPQTDLVAILSEKDVDIDAYNRFILLQLMERLSDQMNALHKAVMVDLPSYFAEFDRVAKDKFMTVYAVIEKSSQIAFELTMLEQLELNERVNQIIMIRQLIMDNKYYHHISSSFDKELQTCSARWLSAVMALWAFLLLVIA